MHTLHSLSLLPFPPGSIRNGSSHLQGKGLWEGKRLLYKLEGLRCWLRVLKTKVCLKNFFITTPELPGRGGEFYINTAKNNPHIPEWGFFL